ncbi:MAG: GntR family transcriptional regulator [Paracoccaceae bacterium]|nr:GntR family transcriptional regulator [Paracoccaceae bacterium]MDE2915470.1 GntR family transcriptional regulator [Paracoccaceae bacterium]
MSVPVSSGSDARTRPLGPKRVDESFIVERIYNAVMEHRLAPATKLNELKLCDTFGVGRMRVRRALLLLSNQGIVDLETNRGAFVASPSPAEANEVFEARTLLESAIAHCVVADIGSENLDMLRQHISLESAARDNNRGVDLIRLSGEFHVKLARASGNTILWRFVRELVTRSSLIVGLFGESNHMVCPKNEHSNILAAIESGKPEEAEALMIEHLNRIREGLNFSAPKPQEGDLAEILGLK